jgi:uncharacterized membrane protein
VHSRWFGAVLVAAMVAASAVCWFVLPEHPVVAWGMFAVFSGGGSRWAITLLLPGVAVVVLGAASVFPRIDPKGAGYAEFLDTYWLIMNTIVLFIAVVQALVLATALGAPVSLSRYAGVGAGGAFMVAGNYVSRLRPNWFIGIRTPWTLSSESVWKQTHRMAGRLLVAGGAAVGAVSVLTRVPLGTSVSVMCAVVAGITLVQSYAAWRREQVTR